MKDIILSFSKTLTFESIFTISKRYEGLNLINDLRSRVFGQRIINFEVVDSTNNRAREMIEKGVEEGTVVIAEEQLAGRGRQGRTWYSEKGKNLLFSLIIKSITSEKVNGVLSLASALSVANAVKNLYGLSVECKWPNDLNINGKKFCGILLESVRKADNLLGICVGIGINVNQLKFPPEINSGTISLAMALGKDLNRDELLREVLLQLENNFSRLKEGFVDDILKEWKRMSPHIGRNISFKINKEVICGIMEDISKDGALVVRKGDKKILLYSGEISYATNI